MTHHHRNTLDKISKSFFCAVVYFIVRPTHQQRLIPQGFILDPMMKGQQLLIFWLIHTLILAGVLSIILWLTPVKDKDTVRAGCALDVSTTGRVSRESMTGGVGNLCSR